MGQEFSEVLEELTGRRVVHLKRTAKGVQHPVQFVVNRVVLALLHRQRYVAKAKMWRRGPERPHSLGFPAFLRHILF